MLYLDALQEFTQKQTNFVYILCNNPVAGSFWHGSSGSQDEGNDICLTTKCLKCCSEPYGRSSRTAKTSQPNYMHGCNEVCEVQGGDHPGSVYPVGKVPENRTLDGHHVEASDFLILSEFNFLE